jgi:hypothetical protein
LKRETTSGTTENEKMSTERCPNCRAKGQHNGAADATRTIEELCERAAAEPEIMHRREHLLRVAHEALYTAREALKKTPVFSSIAAEHVCKGLLAVAMEAISHEADTPANLPY